MTTAFVLGNGVSRQVIAPVSLQPFGKIYACNAIYREFVPDVLVATDRPIATEIQNSGYAQKHAFYTRRPLEGQGARPVPKDYFGYSSGPIATAIAALDGNQRIYMLGFDMGPTPTNTINNVYAGTEFYKPRTAPPTYTGNWIKQLLQIMKDNKTCCFIRVVGPTTAAIQEFAGVKNLEHVDINTFVYRINNPKDL